MAGVGTAYPADYSATYSGPQYTAQEGRTAMAAAMAGATAARPLGGISGVRPGTPNVASATSTTWTVTPFGGYIDLETSASNGGYFFSFLSNSTGTVSAAEGSARVDLLYVQIADTNTGDSTTVAPRVILDYQKGTAGAGVPTLTAARAFVIAQINVPATGGGSPTITWVTPYCAAAGGTVDFNTKAQLDLWTTARAGQRAFVIETTSEYAWSGTGWVSSLKARGRLKGTLNATVNLVNATFTPLTTGLQTDYAEGVTAGLGTLTIVTPGRYRLRAGYVVELNAAGTRNIYITKNNVAVTSGVVAFGSEPGNAVGFPAPDAEGEETLATGDVIRLIYYQNSGANLALRTLVDTNAGIYLEVEQI